MPTGMMLYTTEERSSWGAHNVRPVMLLGKAAGIQNRYQRKRATRCSVAVSQITAVTKCTIIQQTNE